MAPSPPFAPHGLDVVLAGLVLISLCGLYLFTAQSGNAFTTYLIPLVLIVGWRRYADALRRLASDPLYLCLIALLVLLGASAVWSPGATATTVLKAQSRVLFVIAYVTATVLLLARFERFLLWSVIGIATAAALSTLIAGITQHTDLGRLIGFGDLDRAVIAGIAWGAASLLAIHLSSRPQPATQAHARTLRALGVTAALLAFAAMLWSGSRAAWLAYLCGLITLCWLSTDRPRLVLLAWALVLVCLGVWLGNDPQLRDALLPRGDSFRGTVWASTLDAVLHGNWWRGEGMLSRHVTTASGYTIAHPHSVYLATLFHGGIVAAALLMALIGAALARGAALRDRWQARLAATLLVFAAIAIAFDGAALVDKVGYLWLVLWTPLAWTIALGRTPPHAGVNASKSDPGARASSC